MQVLRDRMVQCAIVSGLLLAGCIALDPALCWLLLLWAITAATAIGQARRRGSAPQQRAGASPAPGPRSSLW